MILFAFLNGFLMKNSGIDNWGHMGGLIFGFLISILLYFTGVQASNATGQANNDGGASSMNEAVK